MLHLGNDGKPYGTGRTIEQYQAAIIGYGYDVLTASTVVKLRPGAASNRLQWGITCHPTHSLPLSLGKVGC